MFILTLFIENEGNKKYKQSDALQLRICCLCE